MKNHSVFAGRSNEINSREVVMGDYIKVYDIISHRNYLIRKTSNLGLGERGNCISSKDTIFGIRKDGSIYESRLSLLTVKFGSVVEIWSKNTHYLELRKSFSE